MKKIIKFGIVVFVLLLSTNLFSQQLIVKVVDAETNKPIEFANVSWAYSHNPNKIKGGQITNAEGKATLQLVKGNIQISVSFIGYKIVVKELQPKHQKEMLVFLEPQADELSEVVVFAKSKAQQMRESPEAVSIIGAKELQGRATSVESFLNKNIGIKVRQSGGLGSNSRIMIHGLEGNRVQLLVDGVPMNTQDGMFSIDDIPIDIIERVEVYKSIIPARFGVDGLGGAVNIVTKEFNTNYLDVSYEYSSFQTHRTSGVFRKNFTKSGILIGAGAFYNYSKNNYKFNVPDREHLRIEQDHALFKSYMLKGVLKFTKLWFDEIGFEFGTYNRFNEFQGVMKNVQEAETKQQTFLLENKFEKKGFFLPKLHFEMQNIADYSNINFYDMATLNYDFEGNTYPSPNGYGETNDVPHNSDDKYLNINSRINFDYKFNSNHTLNLNTSFRFSQRDPKDDAASKHAGFEIGGYPSKLFSVINGLTWEAKFFDRKLVNMLSVKNFHIHSKIEDLSSYELQEAPKVKENTSDKFGFIEAVKWQFVEGWHLKASYQRAIRLPTGNEMFGDGMIVFPSAKLRPETSHNINTGFLVDKINFVGLYRLQFELGGFYMKIDDMIKLVEQYRMAGYANINKVEIKGVEAELKLDINPSVYTYANVTYQDVRDVLELSPGTNSPNPTKGLRLPNIPYFFANFGAEYHSDKVFGKDWFVKAFWDSKFTDKFYYAWKLSNKQSRVIPQNWINDAGIFVQYKNTYALSFECHNLSNAEVWNLYRRPLPGRSFHIKFRYTISNKL